MKTFSKILTATLIPLTPLFALTDVYFGPGDWEADTPAQSAIPLYTDSAYQNRVTDNSPEALAGYNIIFSNYKMGNDLSAQWGRTADSYMLGALTFTGYDNGNWHRFQTYGDKDTIVINTVGDITYKDNYWLNEDGSKNYGANIWLGYNIKSVNVGGNFVVENSKGWLGTNFPDVKTPGKATVAGNVELKGDYAAFHTAVGQRKYQTGGSEDAQMGTFDNPDLDIGGYVDFGNSGEKYWVYNNSWISGGDVRSFGMQAYIKLGGLKGAGNIVSSGYTSESKTVFAFNVAAGQSFDFKGVINAESASYTPMDTTDTVDIEIRNAATGVQTLRLGMNGDAGFTGNVTVYSGTLFYGNADYLRKDADHNNLVINGGNFGAAASDAPFSGLDIGDAYFNNIEWNGGKILVDIESLSSIDVIFADTLSGSADVFEFVFNYDGDWADLQDLRIANFFDVGSLSDEQISKFLISDADGRYQGWFEQVQGGYEFMYTAVPEPAAVAALFGALALAFAAYRRRK